MKFLRVIDQAGNRQDYESEMIPRIGERILRVYGTGGEAVQPHYFRVKDVMYCLDNKPDAQAAVLVVEESNAAPWPD